MTGISAKQVLGTTPVNRSPTAVPRQRGRESFSGKDSTTSSGRKPKTTPDPFALAPDIAALASGIAPTDGVPSPEQAFILLWN